MTKPSDRSDDAVMPNSSDGEVFLHEWYYRDWAHTLFAFDPISGQSRIIDLDFSMFNSTICQISTEIYQYSWLVRDNSTKVYKIEGLGSGSPKRAELATLDREVRSFSFAVH